MAQHRRAGNLRGALVQAVPRHPHRRIVFQYNPETVFPGGGVGGWQAIDRQQQGQMTEFTSVPIPTLEFTLFIDGLPDGHVRGTTVENQCQLLKQMGEPRSKHQPPPLLHFLYGPHAHHQHRLWVISDLAWVSEMRNGRLQRIQAEVSVSLMAHHGAAIGLTPAEKHRSKGRSGG